MQRRLFVCRSGSTIGMASVSDGFEARAAETMDLGCPAGLIPGPGGYRCL
jgi:hypothetical protein